MECNKIGKKRQHKIQFKQGNFGMRFNRLSRSGFCLFRIAGGFFYLRRCQMHHLAIADNFKGHRALAYLAKFESNILRALEILTIGADDLVAFDKAIANK